MTNFEKTSIKINKNQFFDRLIPFKAQKMSISIDHDFSIDYDYASVFMSKAGLTKNPISLNTAKSSESDKKIKTCFDKIVQISKTENSINFFIIKPSETNEKKNPDVNDHWESEFKKQIFQILIKHADLFRPELKKFNDDIKMPISFKNENNVKNLKQISYFMSLRDKKAMNEILDSFTQEGRIQKIFLKIVSSASFSVFVIWKNNKLRIVIDLKRINTRLYFDAYSFFKQNVIFSSLNESEIFFFINFTKGFFQQKIELKNR